MARVMVVDDEDVLLEMIATLIEDLGHESVSATSGQEALRYLKDGHEPPSLVISDVMMPRMNGVELLNAIRADTRLQSVPVVLMSAAGRPAHAHNASFFLHKPFELDTLADLIEQFVKG